MLTNIDRPQRPLKVFLVEDSEFMRERLIEEIASARETEFVGSAETESEAVEKLSKLECDAIVLDINLERGSGFTVLKYGSRQSGRPSAAGNRIHQPCLSFLPPVDHANGRGFLSRQSD